MDENEKVFKVKVMKHCDYCFQTPNEIYEEYKQWKELTKYTKIFDGNKKQYV